LGEAWGLVVKLMRGKFKYSCDKREPHSSGAKGTMRKKSKLSKWVKGINMYSGPGECEGESNKRTR